MSIIYTSRNLGGSYGGDYTNGAWGQLMNNYAVRFTSANSGPGSAQNGSTFNFSGSVYFPNSGNYTVVASADNSGSLNVAGQSCGVAGFGSQSSTTFYRARGNYSISGSVYNAPSSDDYQSNPYGIAFTIDAPPAPPKPTVSLSTNKNSFIRGDCATLTWSGSGVGLYSASLTDYSSPGYSGSAQFCPLNTTTYYYQVCGESGCSTAQRTITVYIPPVITVQSSSSSIIAGGNATISWSTTGDADTIYWTSGNLSNGNLNSSNVVSPADTTTYCAYVTGLGGTSPTSCVTLTVYQLPVIEEFIVPDSLEYGEQGLIQYTVKYANSYVKVEKIYNYNTVSTNQGETSYSTSGSAELSGTNTTVSNTIDTDITYDNFGPRSVTYILKIGGSGGTTSISKTVDILIDEYPDNVDLQETDGLFKDQDPVYTPDIAPNEVVTTDLYYIDGIDIPVEIKADYPIKVDVNQTDNWKNVRINTAPPSEGSSVEEPEEITLRSNSLRSNSLVPDQFPLIARPQLNVAYENLITCISIIDESSPAISIHQADWSTFRNNYPYRTFYLLQPAINADGSIRYPISRMNMPNNYINDPYANGTIQVRRDDGNDNLRSDWFALCNLDVVPEGSYVSVWLDISGSMVYATVAASYTYFAQRCQEAGLVIVLETSNSGERWIPGHNQDLPPNGQIYIIEPGTGNEISTISIVAGTCVELTWFAFGEITLAEISMLGQLFPNPVGDQLGFVGTIEVCPTQTTTYRMDLTGAGGSTTRFVTVNVLTPPEIIFSTNPGDSVIAGSCTTISWETTGDADEIIWTSGNITNGNLTSSATVCPQDTTTYCAYADGIAGQSPITCVTITVSQIPTASIEVPAEINYGDQLFINYETQYANGTIAFTPIYTFLDNTTSTGDTINITPVATSAELNAVGSIVSGENIEIPIDWNNIGPKSINVVLNVTGTGGSKTTSAIVNVNIDQTPDNITISETDGKFKDQDPVYTPDIAPDTVVESQLYFINGIDVPVEIKSDYPIKVDRNKEGTWNDVRQIE